jgi:hypothetical protein
MLWNGKECEQDEGNEIPPKKPFLPEVMIDQIILKNLEYYNRL